MKTLEFAHGCCFLCKPLLIRVWVCFQSREVGSEVERREDGFRVVRYHVMGYWLENSKPNFMFVRDHFFIPHLLLLSDSLHIHYCQAATLNCRLLPCRRHLMILWNFPLSKSQESRPQSSLEHSSKQLIFIESLRWVSISSPDSPSILLRIYLPCMGLKVTALNHTAQS